MDRNHSKRENALALLIGSSLVSLGIFFFNQVGLLTGGTAGLALFLQRVTDFSFGELFFVINLPFYWLAYTQMGKRFTLSTLVAVSIVSFCADHLTAVLTINTIHPVYAALFGGGLIGMGMLVMFRHQCSLGGFNTLALFLQQRFGIRAGKVQMALDCSIVILSLLVVEPWLIGLSVAAAITTNLVLAMNHKPGRYQVQPPQAA
ncbi:MULTISPECIES: YitT family protein [Salinivibrio]|uniref:YitT family protein n=2 Tax=Salinivibrio TaxID=51366 RepID=A0ABY7LH82_9GAMM|nr:MULTISPECIES: YitT family protein [Salinivibrio]OOF30341.1 hypothetical protein BZJ20_10755 [Salinivibrio proteolyticus]PCE67047.1 hypothetical protein B6G00_01320 [Salinivibrio sp. YCSC6]QCF36053.1 YitT family protein [Salinivibrio sp. YCSC6]QIR05955.1 YitT family protein [Salinivibrio costicola]WBA15854.1 YitT family protein [Salinivibrio proteolyticus]